MVSKKIAISPSLQGEARCSKEWNDSSNDSTVGIWLALYPYDIAIIAYLLDLSKEEIVTQFCLIKMCLIRINASLVCHIIHQIYIKFLTNSYPTAGMSQVFC